MSVNPSMISILEGQDCNQSLACKGVGHSEVEHMADTGQCCCNLQRRRKEDRDGAREIGREIGRVREEGERGGRVGK